MKISEEKLKMLREQVSSKIHWGARDQEVLDWLEEKYGIADDRADAMLADAHRAKRKAVRGKALMMLVISSLGLLVAGGFIGLQLYSGFFVIGYGSALIIVLGLTSAGAFLRILARLLTGKARGSVD